jgi:hypothetical protein
VIVSQSSFTLTASAASSQKLSEALRKLDSGERVFKDTRFSLDLINLQALSNRNTECPVGAYGLGETALRPGFADRISPRILCTARSALFLPAAAFRIRRLPLSC